MAPLLDNRRRARQLLWLVGLLFLFAAMLPVMRWVPLKLLPFDNKNEVQVLIDMPESASLEQTAAFTRRVADGGCAYSRSQTVAAFIGEPSPIDFNGMVRRYYQRRGPHLADLRLVLADKLDRSSSLMPWSCACVSCSRPCRADGVSIKVVEVPPGPPVLARW
jgi:multidrug efflux pump subunit AcrB